MKIAIMKETNAIDKFERRNLSKKYGINNLIVQPNKIIGTVPTRMDLSNFCFIKFSKVFFKD